MAQISSEQYNQLKQSGLSDEQITNIAQSRGYELPKQGAVSGFAKGAIKGFIGDVARPTAQMLQGLGQRVVAGIDPTRTLEDVRGQTGLRSLDDRTAEGQSVVQSLKTKSTSETVGRVATNIAAFFIPTSPAIQVAGRATQAGGRALGRAGIGLSAKEAPLVQAYKAREPVSSRILAALRGKEIGRPTTNAETALRQGLFGTESMIGIQARRASQNIWSQVVAPALKTAKGNQNMRAFLSEIKSEINQIPELGRKREMLRAFEKFSSNYRNVSNVSWNKLQKYKEGWAKFLPEATYRGKPIGATLKEVQNIAADLARNKIYRALEAIDGKAAYIDYSNLKNLELMGQKAMTGSKLKGGAGTFISGMYDKVVVPVASTGGLALYKTGEGLNFVGRQGARILGEIFK